MTFPLHPPASTRDHPTQDLFLSESDGSSAALARTVDAWSTALKSLGVKPDAKIIESVLEPTRGTRSAFSLHDSITNADEVEQALAKDPTLAKHVNALRGHGQRGKNATLVAGDNPGTDAWLERDGLAWLEEMPEGGDVAQRE